MLGKLIKLFALLALLAAVGVAGWYLYEQQQYPKPAWTKTEQGTIASLWIGNLPPVLPDPSNRVADDPAAARLGHQLFFDTRFSGNGDVACATCHMPDKHFTDGRPLAVGMGVGTRGAPSVVGTAYHPFIFWDGRIDSQWAQALGPMENPVEHGGSRLQFAHLVASDPDYRSQYEAIFGPLPDLSDTNRFPPRAGPVDRSAAPELAADWDAMSDDDRRTVTDIFVNLGKAIAAYERLLLPAPSRFDAYAEALLNDDWRGRDILTRDEAEGLRLFIGDGRCIECHNGPLFSNDGFANIATPHEQGKPYDWGRSLGVQKVLASEFNCLSEFSDAAPDECPELRFIKRVGDDLAGAFKAPGLRNVTQTAPYMHNGKMADLDAVMDHYNKAPAPPFGHSMLVKLDLEPRQLEQLKAFLQSLDSGVAADQVWLSAPAGGDNVR